MLTVKLTIFWKGLVKTKDRKASHTLKACEKVGSFLACPLQSLSVLCNFTENSRLFICLCVWISVQFWSKLFSGTFIRTAEAVHASFMFYILPQNALRGISGLSCWLKIRIQSADCNDDENRKELKKLSLPGGGGRLAKPLECMHESGLWIWWELYSVIFPFSYSAFYISIPLVPQHLLLLPQCPLFLYKNAFEQKSLTWTWKKPINTCLREYTCFYPDN